MRNLKRFGDDGHVVGFKHGSSDYLFTGAERGGLKVEAFNLIWRSSKAPPAAIPRTPAENAETLQIILLGWVQTFGKKTAVIHAESDHRQKEHDNHHETRRGCGDRINEALVCWPAIRKQPLLRCCLHGPIHPDAISPGRNQLTMSSRVCRKRPFCTTSSTARK